MSKSKPPSGDLFLTLTGIWYWKVQEGTKPIEYRDKTPRNISKLRGRTYSHVRYQLGYSSDNQMRLPVVRIVERTDYFEIHHDLSAIEVLSHSIPKNYIDRKTGKPAHKLIIGNR